MVSVKDEWRKLWFCYSIGIALSNHALGSFVGTLLAQWFTSLPEMASGKKHYCFAPKLYLGKVKQPVESTKYV